MIGFIGTSSQLQSAVTDDERRISALSLSRYKAPIWGLRPDCYYSQTVAGLLMWGLSLTRGRFCRLQLLLGLASTVILGYESHRTRYHILLSQIRDFPFRCLLRVAGLRWRYSTPPPDEANLCSHTEFSFITSGEQISSQRLQGFHYCPSWMRCLGNVHEPLPSEWITPCLAPLFRLLGGVYWDIA
jgi:hypothetical protein